MNPARLLWLSFGLLPPLAAQEPTALPRPCRAKSSRWPSPPKQRQTLIFRLDGRDQVVDIADIAHRADPSAPTTCDYQVRAGETWESIAEKELGSAARAADIIALNHGARAEVPPATGSIIRLPKH